MKRLTATLAALLIGLGLAMPAAAQMSDRYEFLKAVKSADGAAALEFLTRPGSTLVNAHDPDTRKTPLHIVTERRDAPWINLLQQHGADINARDANGNTALITAAGLRFLDGVRLLLHYGANVNAANDSGETALIKAVQRRDLDSIRILLKAGADPDQRDSISGLSAREYAERDPRARRVQELIEQGAVEQEEVVGPSL